MSALPQVIIYTDGACDPNPGPGGWAVLMRSEKNTKEFSGSEAATTNNRMELTAAVQALQALTRPSNVDFHTDSQYLQKGITEWLPNWRKRGWRRKGGALKNIDLWQALDSATKSHQISWHWVRGHAGNRENERVDTLARQAILRD